MEALPDVNWISAIVLRQVRHEDLPALEWEGQYIHFRRVFAQAFQRAQRGLSVLWVAELPGAGIIAQVFIQLKCDRPELADGLSRAYLYSFRVKPNFRNAGLGARMLHMVCMDVHQRGFQAMTLTVGKDNPDARRMYERYGFEVVTDEPGIWYYPDERGVYQQVIEPAWRMIKRLAPNESANR